MEPTTDKKSNGALIGTIIIIIMLILGGIYFWSNKTEVAPETQDTSFNDSNEASVIESGLTELEQLDATLETDFSLDVNSVQ